MILIIFIEIRFSLRFFTFSFCRDYFYEARYTISCLRISLKATKTSLTDHSSIRTGGRGTYVLHYFPRKKNSISAQITKRVHGLSVRQLISSYAVLDFIFMWAESCRPTCDYYSSHRIVCTKYVTLFAHRHLLFSKLLWVDIGRRR